MKNSPPAPPPGTYGMAAPATDFEALIDGRRSPLRVYELDLASARSFTGNTAAQIKITGNSFFIDQAADVGNASVIFEGVQDDSNPNIVVPVYVQPGFVSRVPFASIRVANTAQAGKKLRIIYGVDVDFVPSVNASVAVSGSVNAINYGQPYGASYKSVTALAANTPEIVFTPAANANGAILWSAQFVNNNAAGNPQAGYVAKNAAPATIIDGDIILGAHLTVSIGAGGGTAGTLQNAVLIPAGKGLYFIATAAESTAMRAALYTLL